MSGCVLLFSFRKSFCCHDFALVGKAVSPYFNRFVFLNQFLDHFSSVMTSPCDPELNNKIDNVTSLDHFMVVQVDQLLENQRLMLKLGVAVAQEVLLIRRLVFSRWLLQSAWQSILGQEPKVAF